MTTPTRPPARPARAADAPGGPGVFGRRFRLGQMFGFDVGFDASWFFIAALVTWSLAAGWFPARHPGLAAATYWLMGLAGALGLFAAIVLHELSHSLVARREGLEMRGITLFIFGGVAHMGGEPSTPRAELRVAIAGPIASVLIGVVCGVAGRGAEWLGTPVPVWGVLSYLGMINVVLAVFNLVPAFPLDGGRVLRALLWRARGNLRWATRITSQVGSGFGIALIALGVFALFAGSLVSGLWWALIGMFLRNAARMSYQHLVLRETLAGEPVQRFMRREPRTVAPETPVRTLVEEYFYRDYHKLYPVVSDGRLVGCVTLPAIRQVPREEWERRTVGDVTVPCSDANTIGPDVDAVDVLGRMQRGGASRLMVVEDGRLVGIVTLKDLLGLLAVRLELESEPGPR